MIRREAEHKTVSLWSSLRADTPGTSGTPVTAQVAGKGRDTRVRNFPDLANPASPEVSEVTSVRCALAEN